MNVAGLNIFHGFLIGYFIFGFDFEIGTVCLNFKFVHSRIYEEGAKPDKRPGGTPRVGSTKSGNKHEEINYFKLLFLQV